MFQEFLEQRNKGYMILAKLVMDFQEDDTSWTFSKNESGLQIARGEAGETLTYAKLDEAIKETTAIKVGEIATSEDSMRKVPAEFSSKVTCPSCKADMKPCDAKCPFFDVDIEKNLREHDFKNLENICLDFSVLVSAAEFPPEENEVAKSASKRDIRVTFVSG